MTLRLWWKHQKCNLKKSDKPKTDIFVWFQNFPVLVPLDHRSWKPILRCLATGQRTNNAEKQKRRRRRWLWRLLRLQTATSGGMKTIDESTRLSIVSIEICHAIKWCHCSTQVHLDAYLGCLSFWMVYESMCFLNSTWWRWESKMLATDADTFQIYISQKFCGTFCKTDMSEGWLRSLVSSRPARSCT